MLKNLNHISQEHLEQYAMQTLPEPERANLEEHILICSVCRIDLDETKRYVRAMRSASMRMRREDDGEPVL